MTKGSLREGIAERRGGGEFPEILKDGMMENHLNPKRQNISRILKDRTVNN